MKNKEEKPLATEMIHTLKLIIILLILCWIGTIAGFLWYLNQPIDEVEMEDYTQSAEEVENSNIDQNIGE